VATARHEPCRGTAHAVPARSGRRLRRVGACALLAVVQITTRHAAGWNSASEEMIGRKNGKAALPPIIGERQNENPASSLPGVAHHQNSPWREWFIVEQGACQRCACKKYPFYRVLKPMTGVRCFRSCAVPDQFGHLWCRSGSPTQEEGGPTMPAEIRTTDAQCDRCSMPASSPLHLALGTGLMIQPRG
jgi:hypothetical protein